LGGIRRKERRSDDASGHYHHILGGLTPTQYIRGRTNDGGVPERAEWGAKAGQGRASQNIYNSGNRQNLGG